MKPLRIIVVIALTPVFILGGLIVGVLVTLASMEDAWKEALKP